MTQNRCFVKHLQFFLIWAILSASVYAASPEENEKKNSEKSSITSFTERFKKNQEKKEPDSYIKMADDFVNTSGVTELEVGKAPSPEQLKNLKEDMVWIKKEEIDGYTILYPVVYLVEDYNQSKGNNTTEAPKHKQKKK